MRIGLKKIIPLFVVSTVCAVLLRVLQITYITETKTGFFIKEFETLGNIITIGICLIAAVCVIYAALYKKREIYPVTVTKPFGIIHFFLAAAIIYESLFSPVSHAIHTWQILLQIIFGLLSALVFIYRGYNAFTGGKTPPITMVAHIVFWLIRVIIVFSSYISVSTIAENVFEMAAICTALVFFLNAGAYENEIDPERIKKRLFPSAICAAIMGAVYSVAQLVVIISGKSSILHTQNATLITNAVLVIYILFYMVLMFKKPKEELPTETAEQLDMFED